MALENKQNIDVAYLDISRAFDSVPHNQLLSKLCNAGIKGNLLSWFRSFLKGRRQKVRVNDNFSDWVSVTSGVPHGTIIYINDINDNLKTTCNVFADDCLLYICYHKQVETSQLQEDLLALNVWSSKWLLSFNASKCHAHHKHKECA